MGVENGWGTISAVNFSKSAADVACHQLGYSNAEAFFLAMNTYEKHVIAMRAVQFATTVITHTRTICQLAPVIYNILILILLAPSKYFMRQCSARDAFASYNRFDPTLQRCK